MDTGGQISAARGRAVLAERQQRLGGRDVEHLHKFEGRVNDVQMPLAVHGDALGPGEGARVRALVADGADEFAVRVQLLDAEVERVGDEQIAGVVHGHMGRLVKQALLFAWAADLPEHFSRIFVQHLDLVVLQIADVDVVPVHRHAHRPELVLRAVGAVELVALVVHDDLPARRVGHVLVAVRRNEDPGRILQRTTLGVMNIVKLAFFQIDDHDLADRLVGDIKLALLVRHGVRPRQPLALLLLAQQKLAEGARLPEILLLGQARQKLKPRLLGRHRIEHRLHLVRLMGAGTQKTQHQAQCDVTPNHNLPPQFASTPVTRPTCVSSGPRAPARVPRAWRPALRAA